MAALGAEFKSNGRSHGQDIETLFVLMILSLNLSGEPQKEPGLFFSRSFPFSFSVSDALKATKTMSISVDNGSTVTIIKCGIHPDNCEYFLNKFMAAKLLHCPGSRTRETVKHSVLLQPTAKGFYFVERYCRKNGIISDNISKLLLSDFNSMQCIFLDRDINGEIIKSESVVKLLFQRFMGPSPNVYNASNPPDAIAINTLSRIYGQKVEMSLHSPLSLTFLTGDYEQRVSPYAHRYFTHPDSESLTQYYVSSKGVRLYQGAEFYNEKKIKTVVDYCFTSKAAIQWLMDCTDVIKSSDAIELANLFLKYRLIEPIACAPSTAGNSENIVISREAYYQLSTRGKSVLFWDLDHFFTKNSYESDHEQRFHTPDSSFSTDEEQNLPYSNDNTSSSSVVSLQTILEEPALCHLFQEYLEENLCQENLLFYKDMERISDMYGKLGVLKEKSGNEEIIVQYSKSILSHIFAAVGRYFSPRAPFGLNIDSRVKQMIIQEITVDNRVTSTNNDKEIIALVDRMGPLLGKARELVVKMMSQDSLQKFLRSTRYLNAIRCP